MEERNIHEIVEEYRRPVPGEIVEEYVRLMPETERRLKRAALRPDEEFEFEDEEFEAFERRLTRRRRRNLVIFLVCAAVIAGLAAASAFLLPRVAHRYDPFEYFHGEAPEEAPMTGEIHIPTAPFGQGAALTVERDGEQTVLSAKEIYRRVNPAVVTVMAQQGEGMSVGTGVVFTEDGYILTNFHVLDGGTACRVMTDTGYTYDALYVAGDMTNDLAVLKIPGASGMPAAAFGDSDRLSVGDPVYAIGNPLGVELRGTLTDGIVSAINRDVWVDDRYMTLIQTNAALNSGNSGGPLINEFGQVVGINVIKMTSRYSSVEGLGFAIPSASVERLAHDLLTFGEVKPEPLLGVSVIIEADEVESGLWGLKVDSVTEGGVGERAGVQAGDYLLQADGEDLLTSADLLRVRRHHYVGETMTLTVWRDGEILTLTLQLDQSVED